MGLFFLLIGLKIRKPGVEYQEIEAIMEHYKSKLTVPQAPVVTILRF
jgi:hypothetical protein